MSASSGRSPSPAESRAARSPSPADRRSRPEILGTGDAYWRARAPACLIGRAASDRPRGVPDRSRTVPDPCRAHARLGVDTNVFIYLVEGSGPVADRAAEPADAIGKGTVAGCLATLRLAEILTGPARSGALQVVGRYVGELISFDNLALVPLDVHMARDARSTGNRRCRWAMRCTWHRPAGSAPPSSSRTTGASAPSTASP